MDMKGAPVLVESISEEDQAPAKEQDLRRDRWCRQAPLSRPGPNPGRVKRVVSCKRKSHHLTVARKKAPGSGKPHVAANKENQLSSKTDMEQGIFCMDPWDLSQDKHRTGRTDHSSMTNILFGRNLRLKVAFTLWKRNVGELLTYFLRYNFSTTYTFTDISEDSPTVSIGCCVDLFPLVKKILSDPYEEYIIVGLKWLHTVLKNWWEELKESGLSGCTKMPLDKNFQIFNQQLLELWHQEPRLKSVPGSAGDLAMVCIVFTDSTLFSLKQSNTSLTLVCFSTTGH
uniref:Katanin p80 subunit C-terminal domain-containing protein n=1 Tax=Periophthalmus magnuspinnatus TaxID=409849 RepID=A0A3B4ARS7_9GOBI